MTVIPSCSDRSCRDRSRARSANTIIDHLISRSCRMSSRQVLRIFMMILLMIRLILIQVLVRSHNRCHFSRSGSSCSRRRCVVWRFARCWCCSCCFAIRGRGWLARWRRRWRGWEIRHTIHVGKTWDVIDGSHHIDNLWLGIRVGWDSVLLALNMMLMIILKTRTIFWISFSVIIF